MKIGFVGSNSFTKYVGMQLKKSGFTIMGFLLTSFEADFNASEETNSAVFRSLDDLIKLCNIIIISVQEEKVKELFSEIIEKNSLKKQKFFILQLDSANSLLIENR